MLRPTIDQGRGMEAAELLKRTALFAGFNDKQVNSVLGTAKERTFGSGDAIIREGEEGGRGFYLIVEGSAQARKGSTFLADFGPGDYFGEMALLLDSARTADVVATSDVRCVVITQWDLMALIKSHPEIGVQMMAELARRLQATDEALTE